VVFAVAADVVAGAFADAAAAVVVRPPRSGIGAAGGFGGAAGRAACAPVATGAAGAAGLAPVAAAAAGVAAGFAPVGGALGTSILVSSAIFMFS
jgi:hypothetical protein